ncbi:MAG TPA: GNAT family N-acetyltransferase [Polyangiaceae bacterium]
MQIRLMTLEDVPRVLALWRATDGIGLSDADTPDGVARFVMRNPETSWVAEANGQLVGATLAGHDGRRGFLHHLAVQAEFRRRGLGRALVEHALAGLGRAGIRKCHVLVFRSNRGGREFWQEMGFHLRDDIDVHSLAIDVRDSAD